MSRPGRFRFPVWLFPPSPPLSLLALGAKSARSDRNSSRTIPFSYSIFWNRYQLEFGVDCGLIVAAADRPFLNLTSTATTLLR